MRLSAIFDCQNLSFFLSSLNNYQNKKYVTRKLVLRNETWHIIGQYVFNECFRDIWWNAITRDAMLERQMNVRQHWV
jgi:hypothetical protein